MILKMIIQSNSPFNIVKCAAFKELLEMVSGREIHMPTSTTIMSALLLKFNEMKDKLKLELSQQTHVCLTTDIWTHSARSYLGVSVHFYTKNWKFNSYILAFRYLKERHTYDYLARMLVEILNEFDLPIDKITHIVTDGGSNFCKAFKIYGRKTDFSESLAAIEFTNIDYTGDEEEDIVDIDYNNANVSEGEEENDEDEDILNVANIQAEQIEFPEDLDGIENDIMLPSQMRCFAHLLNLIGQNIIN